MLNIIANSKYNLIYRIFTETEEAAYIDSEDEDVQDERLKS